MAGYNKVIILGNLGRDPELRYTSSGTPVCRLSVATSRNWTDKENNKHEETEWHRVVVWGKTAENCNQYLSKGRQVHVEGRLRTSKWTDESGVDRYSTEIVADGVQFVGSGSRDGAANTGPTHGNNPTTPANPHDSLPPGMVPGPEDDDIPF